MAETYLHTDEIVGHNLYSLSRHRVRIFHELTQFIIRFVGFVCKHSLKRVQFRAIDANSNSICLAFKKCIFTLDESYATFQPML